MGRNAEDVDGCGYLDLKLKFNANKTLHIASSGCRGMYKVVKSVELVPSDLHLGYFCD